MESFVGSPTNHATLYGKKKKVHACRIGTFGLPSNRRQPYENAVAAVSVVSMGGLITALGGGIWRKAKARRRAREALRRYQGGTRY